MAMFFIGSIVCFLPVTLFVFGAFGARTVSYIFNQLTFLRFFGEDLTKPSNSALSSHKKNSMMFLMKILLHINEGSAERGASPQKKEIKGTDIAEKKNLKTKKVNNNMLQKSRC